jgi:ubiquinone/menaquinone biosynthesis C-methylase UbiE
VTSVATGYAAGVTATGGASGYALTLSEDELRRYRFMADAARQTEQDLWQAAGIAPGATVADIGCGPGALFPAIMDVIGPGGRLIGVDANPGTVAAAQAMIDAHGWRNATVQVGQAEATWLPESSVDVAMVRYVIGHNGPTEQQIVDHLSALVRPSGHLYLVDVDISMFRVRPSDPARFAAAETIRWLEWGVNSYFYTMVGLTLVLFGAAMLRGIAVPAGSAAPG